MNISVNGHIRELARPITLAELLDDLELNPRRVAVEVNGQLAPRGDHAQSVLRADDCVEIVTLAGGG